MQHGIHRTRSLFLFCMGIAICLCVNTHHAFAGQDSAQLAAGPFASKPAQTTQVSTSGARVAMYRLYNPVTREHLYTSQLKEKRVLSQQKGWHFEGIAWYAPKTSKTPVYRLFKDGAHHYTASKHERDTLLKKYGWKNEGIGWYSDDNETVAVHRVAKPGAALVRAHHYTTSTNERNTLIKKRGWKSEGIGWYALAEGKSLKDGWIKKSGKWTYWLEGKQVKDRWVVTCQRPTADSDEGILKYRINNAGYAQTGLFSVAGKQYYGIPGKIHVLKNQNYLISGRAYKAAANGTLKRLNVSASALMGDSIASAAVAIAGGTSWPAASGSSFIARRTSVPPDKGSKGNWMVYNKVFNRVPQKNPYHAHCGQSVRLAVMWAGVDDVFAEEYNNTSKWTATSVVYLGDYLSKSPKWKRVGTFSRKTLRGVALQPGDVLVTTQSIDRGEYGHICIYVGQEAARKRFPSTSHTILESGDAAYWPYLAPIKRRGGHNVDYYVFRPATSSLSAKYSTYLSHVKLKYSTL